MKKLFGIIIAIIGVGCQQRPSQQIEIKTVTVTNYVTLTPEFGPDGYGFRHLAKQESILVQDCMRQMEGVWKSSTYFEDLEVTKTVTHEKMTATEIMGLLDKQPVVANVTLSMNQKRTFFSLSSLAYPQCEREYRLTKAQWKSLQDFCRLQLIDPIAIKEVVAHWQSITNGIVPFGLKVME